MPSRLHQARELMAAFAARTALSSQRYLWTDAFAVCNWLGLARATGDSGNTELALQTVNQVHRVLGCHRADDSRTGWISGLSEADATAHPTRGGLRIGKPLPERRADEPVNERLEWERDGQYFHYLTKWMHALDQVTRVTGQPLFNRWACELAHTAHRAFTYGSDGKRRRMYWKLSIDLSRPLVASMGQHDPLDGVITCTQLAASTGASEPRLDDVIADFAAMIDPGGLATGDPLGIGGLLVDAYRLIQLEQQGARPCNLLEPVLAAARAGMRHYVQQPDLGMPPPYRLAFRELGLAIGLATLECGEWASAPPAVRAHIDQLSRFASLRTDIETFWLNPEHRATDGWRAHADINDVMLATSLEPRGFLALVPLSCG